MSTKQAFEMFLHFDPNGYPEPMFCAHSFDMTSCGYVLVNKQTVELEVPDNFDPVPAQVSALKAEREQIAKKFGAKLMELDDRIGKLLCLPNEVTA